MWFGIKQNQSVWMLQSISDIFVHASRTILPISVGTIFCGTPGTAFPTVASTDFLSCVHTVIK